MKNLMNSYLEHIGDVLKPWWHTTQETKKKNKQKVSLIRNVYFAPFIEVNIDCIGDARYKPLWGWSRNAAGAETEKTKQGKEKKRCEWILD